VTSVNFDQTKSGAGGPLPGNPTFIRDRNGQTLFFVCGPRHRGYVVPDARHEWTLRDAAERFTTIDRVFGWTLVPPFVVSILAIGGPHSVAAIAALTAIIATSGIGKVIERKWFFGELVAGLERVEPIDVVGRRRQFIALALVAVAYFSFVAWQVWQAIQSNPN
jgi:hypothetical protein